MRATGHTLALPYSLARLEAGGRHQVAGHLRGQRSWSRPQGRLTLRKTRDSYAVEMSAALSWPRAAVRFWPVMAVVLAAAVGACSDGDTSTGPTAPAVDSSPGTSANRTSADSTPGGDATPASGSPATTEPLVPDALPGMPPVLDLDNVYAGAGPGDLAPASAASLPYVYVPTNQAGTVTVIDQGSLEVLAVYQVGDLVQHVVPDWDFGVLYATASSSNELVPFDPTTGRPGQGFRIDAPYNLYFTPDGKRAVVMAERRNRIDYYDRRTWELLHSIDTPCDGPNHADWSLDGRWFVVTCEFSGQMLRIDTVSGDVLDVLDLAPGSKPQDVRLVGDGSRFYIADLAGQGVQVLDAASFAVTGTIATGHGPHSVYPSRDGRSAYVANRHEGSVSVIDVATDTVVDTWTIPGGGSPDMGGVSSDGSRLWLSGRNHDEVYVFDTSSGELLARIPIPGEPHGLAVIPQPGRYSLGHTANTR
jgi:YVTN family beta-propeller protein